MPAGGLVVAGVAGLGSSIIGAQQAGAQRAAAQAAQQAAVQQWLSINVPDPKQQQIELQNYKVAGTLSPQLQKAFSQSQTGLKNLNIDPSSRAAEIQALTQMQDVAKNGGMDAQAKQQLQQGITATNANEQGQRGAIVQNAAARGVGGSGAQLEAELEASQGDANQAAATGQASAASAEQRALQAMTASGQMGSNINSQDYSQASQAATAQDAINRFNTQTQQGVEGSNVKTQNDAQAANLANAQAVSNANTGVANQQETANKALIQQQFNDQTKIASGIGSAETGAAAQDNTNAAAAGNQWSKIGQAVGQGATAIAEYDSDKKDEQDSSQGSTS